VLASRSGVADSIEQHIMKRDKPGGQTLLGAELKRIEYAVTTLSGRAANERLVRDDGRDSEEAG
jgi:hypothetical protein